MPKSTILGWNIYILLTPPDLSPGQAVNAGVDSQRGWEEAFGKGRRDAAQPAASHKGSRKWPSAAVTLNTGPAGLKLLCIKFREGSQRSTLLFLPPVWRKDSEENTPEDSQQAVGAGEQEEEEGVYRRSGKQVSTGGAAASSKAVSSTVC